MKITRLFAVIAFVLLPLCLHAQVTIAPTNMYIDGNARFGTYMVINNSNDTQEISIDFLFAYSQTDEQGNRTVIQNDTVAAKRYSIAEYIRAFPRNFTLAPGQRQVVRLRLNPPSDLDDGTYWARIKTGSTPEAPPLELQASNAVAARVGIRVEQVTGLFFKKGSTTTGIEVDEITTNYDQASGKLLVFTDLDRTGNSPFLGSITTSLISQSGEVVREGFISTTIYFDGVHRNEFDIADIPNGQYTIRVEFESSRSDIPSSDLVQMSPVIETTTFTKR
jgi:hypothetical protein